MLIPINIFIDVQMLYDKFSIQQFGLRNLLLKFNNEINSCVKLADLEKSGRRND
jgi:hypothetical protein